MHFALKTLRQKKLNQKSIRYAVSLQARSCNEMGFPSSLNNIRLSLSKPVLKASPVKCGVEYVLSFARTMNIVRTFLYADWTPSLWL